LRRWLVADVYTPTTDAVREAYAVEAGVIYEPERREAEFDRWLAAHDREVAAKALREWAAEVVERYPEDVFLKPSAEHYAALHQSALERGGTLDAIAADIMRRAAAQARRAADEIEATS
jgi:hypothetical protein